MQELGAARHHIHLESYILEDDALGRLLADMLMDNDPLYWRTLIREQMEMDRQRVNSIRITPKGIEIDATY